MAESNGSLWDKQPGPDWFPEDYLREDYLPSLSRSLSEDFRDYVVGTRDNAALIHSPKFEKLAVEGKHTN